MRGILEAGERKEILPKVFSKGKMPVYILGWKRNGKKTAGSFLAERRKHVFIGNGFAQSQADGGRQAQSKQDFAGDSAGGQPERTETKNAGGREILPLRP